MSSEQQTVPQATQETTRSSRSLLLHLQELILDDSTSKKWKSGSASSLPAIVQVVMRKINRDLPDGPQRTRFIKALDYLQPNARQFQDFVRFVMTTNLNEVTLTRISVSKNVTFDLFSRLGIRKIQYKVEEVLNLAKTGPFRDLHDCVKIPASEIQKLNGELAHHRTYYPMSCERVAEERVRKYLNLLFRRKYAGASLTAIPLASTPNESYGVAEVESEVDGVIHKTYLTGNIDIALGIVAWGARPGDLPTNKFPRDIASTSRAVHVSRKVRKILMQTKENGSYGHFLVRKTEVLSDDYDDMFLEMVLIEVKRPHEDPDSEELTSVVHLSSHLHQILSMCCGVGYYNPERRSGVVKFLLTDSVGFVWGVFDHQTFEAHYTEVLINNMEERTADVVEFFRVWPIVPGEVLMGHLLKAENRCEGFEQVENDNDDLSNDSGEQDDDDVDN